jgi:hypothetical protein
VEILFDPVSVFVRPCSRALIALAIFFAAPLIIAAQTQFSTSEDGKTMTVYDAPEMEVVAFGKSVIVKNRAKGVSAIGGDVVVEGIVTGDVATLGGSIIQRNDAYIGGDVIVIGGAYKPDGPAPRRETGKETVVVGVFENELRDLAQNPSQIFSPDFTLTFLAQRLLSVLFWFVVSFALTTLAPGAISRAIARFQLSTLKVSAIGILAFVVTLIGVLLSVQFLPNYLSVSLGLMAIMLLMLAYIFGRVALQVSVGKLIQKHLLPDGNRSETLAILFGVLFWTLLLSVPYVWTLAVLALFVAGLGLVLTAKTPSAWRQT